MINKTNRRIERFECGGRGTEFKQKYTIWSPHKEKRKLKGGQSAWISKQESQKFTNENIDKGSMSYINQSQKYKYP